MYGVDVLDDPKNTSSTAIAVPLPPQGKAIKKIPQKAGV